MEERQGGTRPFNSELVEQSHVRPPATNGTSVDPPIPLAGKSLGPIPPSVQDDLWAMFKAWFGAQGAVDELGLIEQRAAIDRQHPLEVLRRTIRYVVQNGLWGGYALICLKAYQILLS